MRNVAQIHLEQIERNAVPKKNSDTTLDDTFRFTGNLIAYREELAFTSPANSSRVAGSSKDDLVQRYNAKRDRVVSLPTKLSRSRAAPADPLPEVEQTQRSSWVRRHGRIIAAIIGCMLIAVGLSRPWKFSTQQISDSAPSDSQSVVGTTELPSPSDNALPQPTSSTADAISGTTAAVDTDTVVALKKRLAESDSETAEYRNEVLILRDENGLLVNENMELLEETISLNRELLDLEVTVVALQDELVGMSPTETRVVYNFVNVPIGEDPDDGYYNGSEDPVVDQNVSPVVDQDVNKSSYNNSPSVFTDPSASADAPSNWESGSTQPAHGEITLDVLNEMIRERNKEGS